MNIKGMVYFLAIFFVLGCNADKLKQAQAPERTFYANYLYNDSSGVMYFECEDFANNALNNYTISELDRMFEGNRDIVKRKDPFRNVHDRDVTDTIYTFAYEHNIIQIYQAKHGEFIFTFDVTDPRLKLYNTISTGMNKKNFADKFHILENLTDMVVIRNNESTVKFLFYFNQNLLYRINSYLYLD